MPGSSFPNGPELGECWHGYLGELCDLLAGVDPRARIPWFGPDMSARMFATARQMETWAHGQDVYDLLEKPRTNTDRIKNIAVIGVRTFGWTFANRGLDVPAVGPLRAANRAIGRDLGVGRTGDGGSRRGLSRRVLPCRHPGTQHRRHRLGRERRDGNAVDGHRAVLRGRPRRTARTWAEALVAEV